MLKLNLEFESDTKENLVILLKAALKQVEDGDNDIGERIEPKCFVDGEIIDTDEERRNWEKESGYKLSDNQVRFCKDAEDSGHDIDFTYSGRGMFGKTCPSVRIDERSEIETTTKVKEDSMGRGIVVYAQN